MPQEFQPRRLHGERGPNGIDAVVDTGAPQTVSIYASDYVCSQVRILLYGEHNYCANSCGVLLENRPRCGVDAPPLTSTPAFTARSKNAKAGTYVRYEAFSAFVQLCCSAIARVGLLVLLQFPVNFSAQSNQPTHLPQCWGGQM